MPLAGKPIAASRSLSLFGKVTNLRRRSSRVGPENASLKIKSCKLAGIKLCGRPSFGVKFARLAGCVSGWQGAERGVHALALNSHECRRRRRRVKATARTRPPPPRRERLAIISRIVSALSLLAAANDPQ